MTRLGSVLLLLLLAAGCAAGGGSGGIPNSTPEDTATTAATYGETTGPSGTPSETTTSPVGLHVEQIAANAPGHGRKDARVVVAPSADDLSEAIGAGAKVPDSGEGTYLAAFWGEKPTGGYSTSVVGALRRGDSVSVTLALKEPPRDALVAQSLTYPYVLAVVRNLDPAGKDFVFLEDGDGALGWPVERVGG